MKNVIYDSKDNLLFNNLEELLKLTVGIPYENLNDDVLPKEKVRTEDYRIDEEQK